jgi:hypothetical protein
MTPVHRERINHPAAWTSRELGGPDLLRLALNESHLSAMDELLVRTGSLRPQDVKRADFDHPVINTLADDIRCRIMSGRGVVIVSGLTSARYTEEQFERIYWGLGTHLGTGAVQSALGDRLARVENNLTDKVKRGYRSPRDLHMHTDSYEVVGLMCVRAAKSGGFSGLASSLAVHNELLATRPDLLAPLYRGYRFASEEGRFSSMPVTADPIPVFSVVDGVVSCTYEPAHMKNAAVALGEPLPADLEEALDMFDEIANRDDIALRFLLQPGEMLLWHNYTNLHSRTAFEDDPQRPRLLLRLWLSVPKSRPYDPAFRIRSQSYERIYRETIK